MKLFVRSLLCLVFLLGSLGGVVLGILIHLEKVGYFRQSDGLLLSLLSIGPLFIGSVLLFILIRDYRYISVKGYKSFKEVSKDSSVHKVFPFFRRDD